jgi:3-oxoacyl-[acyl-carrier protein] reductase
VNNLDMQGRNVVVTGGASGIGLEIVNRLTQSGAKVAIWDVNEKTLSVAASAVSATQRYAVKVDVTSPVEVEGAFQSTLAAFGKVDALVNSAGVPGKNALLWQYPIDEWLRVIDINLHGTFQTCRTVVPHMINNRYGRIVNIASIAGKEGNPNLSAYSAAKAAVIGLTKSLGKELARTGVIVNSVAPAAIKTPLFDQLTPSFIDYILAKIPMGRFGKVEEAAAMICWMCTEECSFTTGACFDLSGGRATY